MNGGGEARIGKAPAFFAPPLLSISDPRSSILNTAPEFWSATPFVPITLETCGVGPESSEENVDAAFLHGAFQAPLNGSPDRGPSGRNQADETDDVGQYTRRDEKRSRNKDNYPVDQLLAGKATPAKTFIEPLPDSQSLSFREIRARHSGQCDNADGGPEADELTELDEQCELKNRRQEKKCEQSSEHSILQFSQDKAQDQRETGRRVAIVSMQAA